MRNDEKILLEQYTPVIVTLYSVSRFPAFFSTDPCLLTNI